MPMPCTSILITGRRQRHRRRPGRGAGARRPSRHRERPERSTRRRRGGRADPRRRRLGRGGGARRDLGDERRRRAGARSRGRSTSWSTTPACSSSRRWKSSRSPSGSYLLQVMLIGAVRADPRRAAGHARARLRPHRQHRQHPLAGREPLQERLRRRQARPGRLLQGHRARDRRHRHHHQHALPELREDAAGRQADRRSGARPRHARVGGHLADHAQADAQGRVHRHRRAGRDHGLSRLPGGRATSPGRRSSSTAAGPRNKAATQCATSSTNAAETRRDSSTVVWQLERR